MTDIVTTNISQRGCKSSWGKAGFIERARKIHGESTYSYDLVEYKDVFTKVKIICPVHGIFGQHPTHHIHSALGCAKCAKEKVRTLAQAKFIQSAQRVHGSRYTYEKVVYNSNCKKVEITCHQAGHGSFWQTPGNHSQGQNCPKCKTSNSPDTKEVFVEKARRVHGSTYGYDRVHYVDSTIKVEIICYEPGHGSFWMKPNSHVSGKQGCPKCRGNRPIQEIFAEFLERSRARHGNRYDYSHTVLEKASNKVRIDCPKCGPFYQLIYKHMRGDGCPECSKTKKATTDSFRKSARSIHGDRYGYEQVNYLRGGQKVEIICEEHGPFWLTPNHHLHGVGCAKCGYVNTQRRSEFVKLCEKQERKATLYFVQITLGDESFHKLGITSRTIKERFRPEKIPFTVLDSLTSIDAGWIWDLEKQLLQHFRQYFFKPKISFAGETECFLFPNPDQVRQHLAKCNQLFLF